MSPKGKELWEHLEREVAEWEGVEIEYVEAGRSKHPKVKFTYRGKMLSHPIASSPSDRNARYKMVARMRQIMRKLGAERSSDIDDEAAIAAEEAAEKKAAEKKAAKARPKNEGKAKRPDPEPVDEGPADERPTVSEQFVAYGIEPAEDYDAMIREAADAIVDGIYFGLKEDVYHACGRLSASGIKKIGVSPGFFWKGSWLDPNRPKFDADSSDAQIVGKAYHAARFEPERFETDFIRKIEKSDFADQHGALFTQSEIKRVLAEEGLVQSGLVLEQARRLEDAGYPYPIWHCEEDDWKKSVGDRTVVPGEKYDQILADMELMRAKPEIIEKLTGGAAEVSIFWTDDHGIKMKTRIDYLRPALWAELKTFSNPQEKELFVQISQQVRYRRYHVQAAVQREAIEAIRGGNLEIIGAASELEQDLVAQLKLAPADPELWFIFMETGGIPNILERRFKFHDVPASAAVNEAGATDEQIERARAAQRRKTGIYTRALMDIDHAKRKFALYSQVYKPGQPWAFIESSGEIDDLDFPDRWLSGEYE